MRTTLRGVAYLVGLACFTLPVQAGVVVQQEEREPGSANPTEQITMYIDAGKLRIESKDPTGEKSVMIFDQAKQVIWLIDPNRGTYYEITAAKVQEMNRQMDAAWKQMEAQLAQMPPEQRKMVEQMMKQQMGARPPSVKVQVKSRGEKVGSYVCTRYEVLTDGRRSHEVWVAPVEQVLLQDAEYKTFQAMGEFYEPLSRNAPEATWGVPGSSQMEGIPVRSLDYEGERVVSEWKVVNAERRALEPSLFTLPSGLQKTEMPGQRR